MGGARRSGGGRWLSTSCALVSERVEEVGGPGDAPTRPGGYVYDGDRVGIQDVDPLDVPAVGRYVGDQVALKWAAVGGHDGNCVAELHAGPLLSAGDLGRENRWDAIEKVGADLLPPCGGAVDQVGLHGFEVAAEAPPASREKQRKLVAGCAVEVEVDALVPA